MLLNQRHIHYAFRMTIVPGTYSQSLAVSGANKPNWKQKIGVVSLLLVIICGISLRFFGLAEREVWLDEAHTLRTLAPVDVIKLKGQVFTGAELDEVLRPTFDINGLWQTIDNTRQISDQVPLYYLIARFFCPFFENTLFAARLLAAFLSVLATPIFYLWVLGVTRSKGTALIGAAIVSVSPFLMLYASEARGYTLWVVTLIILNHLCWQMDRLSGWKQGVKYGTVLCAVLMSHLASLLIVPGHAAFMLLQGVKKKVIMISFLPLAVAVAIWSVFQGKLDLAFNRILSTGWMSEARPIDVWLERLSVTFARAFFDDGSSVMVAPLLALIPIGFVISGFFVKTSTKHRLFLLALLCYPLILMALDLCLGGKRALTLRYQAPTLVLFLLEASMVIGVLVASNSKARRILGGFLLTSVLVAGLASGIAVAGKRNVWIKQSYTDFNQANQFMEGKRHPLFLCPSFEIAIVASRNLSELARFKVHIGENLLIPPNTDGIRILNSSRLENGSLMPIVEKNLHELYPNIPITVQDN